MNIVITGGAGFLGSYITEKLLAKGHHVSVIDMADGSKIEHLMDHPQFRFHQDSILNTELLNREMTFDGCNMIFHFAAIADPKRYVSDPLTTLEIDLQGSLNVFRAAAKKKIKVVFASTSEVYGKNPNVPWKEEDDRVLGSTHINRWCYSTAKSAGEHYLYAYHQKEGVPYTVFRFFNVYGPRLDDLGSGRVLPIFLEQFLKGQPVTIHGDGKQTRSFAYVEDVVEGIVQSSLSQAGENQIFNIGNSRETSIAELAELVKKVGNFKSPIVYVPHKEVFGASYEDIPRRIPNVSKIKRLIGWEDKTPLEEGLKKTIEYYKKRTLY